MRILHLTHPWGGGIASYIEDLQAASSMSGEKNQHLAMRSSDGFVQVSDKNFTGDSTEKYYLGQQLKLTDYHNEKYYKIFEKILNKYKIDIVQIDSHVGHTFDIFTLASKKKIPVILVVHDFFYICPTFHLVDKNGLFCHICRYEEERVGCIENHPYLYSDFSREDLLVFRGKFQSILESIDAFVFPSQAAKDLFTDFYPVQESLCRVLYHGSPLEKNENPAPRADSSNLRVGILGSMLKHKGQDLLQHILVRLKDSPVNFYHYGDGALKERNLVRRGRYDRHQITHLIQSDQIDIILLLSTWPETFSYTLSEAIAASVPVVVTDLGALAERVRADGIGWIVNYQQPDAVVALISRLAITPSEVLGKKAIIQALPLKSLAEMNAEYDGLYQSLNPRAFSRGVEKGVNVQCRTHHSARDVITMRFIRFKVNLAKVRRRLWSRFSS